MKHGLNFYITLPLLLMLPGCVDAPPEAYRIRTPESLLISDSSIVTMELSGNGYLENLNNTLASNPPSHAVLNCPPDDANCKNAAQLLAKYAIATENSGTGSNVTLLYDSIAARNCDQSYVDNSQNERNLNYEAFGCSISGNTVQMVTDKRQFTNPHLLDYRDGEKTASTYNNYLNPPAASSSSGGGSGNSGSLIPASSGSSGGSQ